MIFHALYAFFHDDLTINTKNYVIFNIYKWSLDFWLIINNVINNAVICSVYHHKHSIEICRSWLIVFRNNEYWENCDISLETTL